MIQGRGRNILVSRVATICYNPTCAGVAVSGEFLVRGLQIRWSATLHSTGGMSQHLLFSTLKLKGPILFLIFHS